MICPNCNNQNSENSKFCSNCGSKLPTVTSDNLDSDKIEKEIVEENVVTESSAEFVESLLTEDVAEDTAVLSATKGTVKKSKSKKKKILVPVIALFVVVSLLITYFALPEDFKEKLSQTVSNEGPFDPSHTIMIYIVGSDLESMSGAATLDIDEMVESEFNTDVVNVILCTGGASKWQNSVISEDDISYYSVTDDVIKVHTTKQKNMGKASTLSDFLQYSVENYSTAHYSLVLWNHGGGPMTGFGIDETTRDYLELEELKEALEDSPFNEDNKLDMLGFDACLMGTIETAWAFKDYAEYFIGSQETEPGYGWDYSFLSEVDKCKNGGELGKVIIDDYFDFYEDLFEKNSFSECEITLSCLDLSKIESVEQEINKLFKVVDKDISKGNISAASRSRYRSKSFGKFNSTTSYDLVDLKHFSSLLSSSYSQAEDLENSLDDLVVYSRANVKNSNGVSIYHPYDDIDSVKYYINTYKSFDFASDYTGYIKSFSEEISNDSVSYSSYRNFSKTMGSATENKDNFDLSIQLTEEQQKTFSAATYYVFWEMPSTTTFSDKTEYLQVFSGQDITLSSDGKLLATYNGKAVFGKDNKTGKYSDCPLSMYQINDGTNDEKFYFPCIFWHFGEDGLDDFDSSVVNWLMRYKNGVPTLLNAYEVNENSENKFADKCLIDVNDFTIYTFANNSYFVNQKEDGTSEFIFTGSSYGFEYTKEDGFSIESRPIPDKSQYKAVFAIEDVYGNRYFSDFIPLG